MFEEKRGLKIAIYVKEFSEKEKRLFPDKDQMKICKEFKMQWKLIKSR